MSSIKTSLITVVYWAGYWAGITGIALLVLWAADCDPVVVKNDWHWYSLAHTCLVAAIGFFIATLIDKNICWACAAGIGFGLGLHMIILLIRPEGYVFSPFVDNAFRGTAGEDIIWLVTHTVLAAGIGILSVRKIRV
jgi:hypothetical protein